MNNLKILHINYLEKSGGAARIAWTMHRRFQSAGHTSWMAVAHKESDDAAVFQIPGKKPNSWIGASIYQFGQSLERKQTPLFVHSLGRRLRKLSQPQHYWDWYVGREDFGFPGGLEILELPGEKPDIVQLHNLHPNYFDLRSLPALTASLPTVLTLHDAWLLSGHCAHSLDCERWNIGCGQCPYLDLYPAVHRDATAFNWSRKKKIYEQSDLYVVSPSKWLMKKVEQSILVPAIKDSTIIYNGVDCQVFKPGDKDKIRQSLGIPNDGYILLSIADDLKKNPYKDYLTTYKAVQRVAERTESKIYFVAIGGDGVTEKISDNAFVIPVPFKKDVDEVVMYYQAADLYLHAARAETFPSVILEAMACGLPVICTAVGGIPEQITDEVTGFLIPAGDTEMMAQKIELLLSQETLRNKIGRNARQSVEDRFDLNDMINQYLEWYMSILLNRRLLANT